MSERFPLGFVAVGPQRTGSTWLDHRLRGHPALAFPKDVKETFFFDRDWARGPAHYAWHFRDAAAAARWAEVGPTYFDHAEAPGRIRTLAHDARILITLRDPVERAASLFQHHHRKGRVPSDFTEAARRIPTLVDAGDYATHVPRWIEAFGRERVLIVLIDDVEADPGAALDRITDWLGIARVVVGAGAEAPVNAASVPRHPGLARVAAQAVGVLRRNRLHGLVEWGKRLGLNRVYSGGAEAPPGLTEAERAELAARYAPHVAYVERLLGRDLSAWGQPAEVA